MKLAKMASELDSAFHVANFDESSDWKPFLPEGYGETLAQYAAESFLEGTWNGLMLANSEEIDRVYLVVFPSQPVLDTILAWELKRGAPGAMIFAHHMTGFDPGGGGFQPIPEAQLEELKQHHISFYHCHAPLDCHPEISTSRALAEALHIRDLEPFSSYYGGFAGVHGRIPASDFAAFAARAAQVCEIPCLRADQLRHNGQPVAHIAILAGGGNEVDDLSEAESLGCDTYLTGQWWIYADNDYGREQREQMREFLAGSGLNIIGTSHDASERIVMRDKMVGWFRERGLDAKLVTP
jgi:putative NIF3 family GTP cyclohydrolase 1 type 2